MKGHGEKRLGGEVEQLRSLHVRARWQGPMGDLPTTASNMIQSSIYVLQVTAKRIQNRVPTVRRVRVVNVQVKPMNQFPRPGSSGFAGGGGVVMSIAIDLLSGAGYRETKRCQMRRFQYYSAIDSYGLEFLRRKER